jgi:ABC-type multidrug transport system ATPase subunit
MTENISFAIRTSQLGRDFGTTKVLQNVSMSIPTGSVCALLGQNGAGKTTLLKLLMGLIQATAGVSSVLGDPGWPRQMRTLSRVGCLLDGFEPSGATQIRHLLDLSWAASPQFDARHARQLLDSRGLAPNRRWSTLSKVKNAGYSWR